MTAGIGNTNLWPLAALAAAKTEKGKVDWVQSSLQHMVEFYGGLSILGRYCMVLKSHESASEF